MQRDAVFGLFYGVVGRWVFCYNEDTDFWWSYGK